MADAEVDVRLDAGELEDRLDEIVRADPVVITTGAEPRAPLERLDDREHLDRLRPRPHQDEHVAELIPFAAVRSSDSFRRGEERT